MITIRKADLKDVPAIAGLWTEFMGLHEELVLKENKKLEPFLAKRKNAANNYRKFLQEKIKSKNGAVFLAEADGVAAGFALIFVKDEIPIFKIRKMGQVSDLFVKKEFRGQGISSKLKNKAIKWFKEKGINHISILLYKDNKLAHSIYEKWGLFDYKVEMRKKI